MWVGGVIRIEMWTASLCFCLRFPLFLSGAKGAYRKGGFMYFQLLCGRVPGLLVVVVLSAYCSRLDAASASASSMPSASPKDAEVAIKYKVQGLGKFRLADYAEELLECSALSAIHMWIGDNIGEDAGSEIRKAIDSDYWLEISKEYLSLAKEASGKADLSLEVRARIKGLATEWRRLNETSLGSGEWVGWYDLIDRCDTWRPEITTRSYYNRGRKPATDQNQISEVATSPAAVWHGGKMRLSAQGLM